MNNLEYRLFICHVIKRRKMGEILCGLLWETAGEIHGTWLAAANFGNRKHKIISTSTEKEALIDAKWINKHTLQLQLKGEFSKIVLKVKSMFTLKFKQNLHSEEVKKCI